MSVTEKSKCPSHFDKAAAVAAVAAVAENNKREWVRLIFLIFD